MRRKQPSSQNSSENLSITLTQELGAEPVDDSDLRAAIDSIYQLLRNEVERRLASPSSRSPNANGNAAFGKLPANLQSRPALPTGFPKRNGNRPQPRSRSTTCSASLPSGASPSTDWAMPFSRWSGSGIRTNSRAVRQPR